MQPDIFLTILCYKSILTCILIIHFCFLPGGSSRLSDCSGAAVAALVVMGLAFALVTGVTAVPPLAVTLLIADLVASFTSLNLSINCKCLYSKFLN